MKKVFIVVSIVLAVLVVAGCKHDKKTEEVKKQETVMDKAKSAAMNIKDAIAGGKSMECEVKVSSEGNMVISKFSVRGEKSRSEMETGVGKRITIFDGKTVHSWNEATKEGIVNDSDCLEGLETSVPEEDDNDNDYPTYKSSEEIAENAPETVCQPVGSIDFSIPTDVNFIDQCEMIKQMQESLKNLNPQMMP
ncbi:hypothetical protein BMS3Abin15_00165 [bacterium BMS3Abin15]|nr:hypothetical protein BMS3Abin15_00165 [bacterium BMS3Abin15]